VDLLTYTLVAVSRRWPCWGWPRSPAGCSGSDSRSATSCWWSARCWCCGCCCWSSGGRP